MMTITTTIINIAPETVYLILIYDTGAFRNSSITAYPNRAELA
jgi:hypothetical protein